jgi:hypothetical protein
MATVAGAFRPRAVSLYIVAALVGAVATVPSYCLR